MNVYLYKNDEQYGPYSLEEVQAYLNDGTFTSIDSAWYEGCVEWTTISHLPGIVLSEQKKTEHLAPPFEAYSGDQPYVFISYAHRDGAVVYDEIQRLHDAGYRIWYDEGIEVSNEWPEEIANAVIACSVFLVFVSPRSAASVNCRNEINMALNKNKSFLAVYLEETDLPPGLELRMGDLQAILKFRMPDSTYCKKVFAGLGKLLGEGGRDVPQGEDPVAKVMAAQPESDFLSAPVEDDLAVTRAPDTQTRRAKAQTPRAQGKGQDKGKGKGLWIGIGAVFVACLAWFFFTLDDSDESNVIAVPQGQAPPPGYVLFQRGDSKPFEWREMASVSKRRYAYDGVEVLDGKIYFVGGLNESGGLNLAERYDPATNQWETLPPMTEARRGVATAVLDGKLYAIGGMGLESVEIFDPKTNEWSFGSFLPAQVKFGTAIGLYGNQILLFGGLGADNRALDQVLQLRLGDNNTQWRLKTTMPTARNSVKLIKRKKEIWVIGGYDNSYSARIEAYEPSTDSWTKKPSLGTPRDWPVAWLANDRIYVGGGQKDSRSYLQSIEVFDFEDNQWTSAGSLPEPLGAADSVVVDGKVFLVAGSGPNSDYSNKVYAADISGPKDLYIRISSQESE